MIRRQRKPKGRKKISVLLTYEEATRFEEYCVDRGFKKTTLVARLIRDHLDNEAYRLQKLLSLDRRPSEEK